MEFHTKKETHIYNKKSPVHLLVIHVCQNGKLNLYSNIRIQIHPHPIQSPMFADVAHALIFPGVMSAGHKKIE